MDNSSQNRISCLAECFVAVYTSQCYCWAGSFHLLNAQEHAHACTHTYTCKCMHTHRHTCMCVHTRLCMHTQLTLKILNRNSVVHPSLYGENIAAFILVMSLVFKDIIEDPFVHSGRHLSVKCLNVSMATSDKLPPVN